MTSPTTVAAAAMRRMLHRRGAVAADRRVVVEAVEQRLVDDRADLAAGRLDQRQPHVARREVDAEEVARDPPVGRQDDDARGVRVLVALARRRRSGSRRRRSSA